MAPPIKYVPFYTEVFLECLEKNRNKQDRVLALVERICEAPKISKPIF